jgi:hypothetical protein
MTQLGLLLPQFNYQVSQNGSAYAAAAASANGSSASASAGAGTGIQGLFNGFNQLNNVAGQQQSQNPMMGMFQMMMQFMMGMFQMMMQMFGMGQQQNQGQQPQNAMQNPQGQFPFAPANAAQQTPFAPANGQTGASAAAAANAQGNNNALLSKVDQKELDAVKGQDLGAVDSKGYPKYLIAQGKDGKHHIYKQKKDGNGRNYRSVVKVKSGSNNLYVDKPEKNKAAAAAAAQNGGSSAAASASAVSISYNPVTGEITFSAASAAAAAASGGSPGIVENQGGGKTGSPLILDTNKDGKVSAEQGKGVDINGDGKADGAAANGDKMLAMGDLDGDGKISGKEVFGDQTVDPFTGQKLNAKNGFDALAKVAQSAQQNTGIQCLDDNGNVDLPKLKQALEQSGKGSLGLIGGDNVTTLEGLGDAAKINVTNYINQQQTGAVQHNQLGSYQSADGQTHQVHDVWFQLA